MPEDPKELIAILRRGIRRALPLLGLAAFVALALLLVTTEVKANDAPTGEHETRVYIQRTFYAVLTIGLLFAACVASRGEK